MDFGVLKLLYVVYFPILQNESSINKDCLVVLNHFNSLGLWLEVYSPVIIFTQLAMVYCAAFGCNNDSRSPPPGVSYFRFPRDDYFREQWLRKISRADLVLTKHSRLCSEHFTPDCFERDLKAELLGLKPQVSLKPDAVPSIFSHRPPPTEKPRLSSEKRLEEKAKKEVRVLSILNFSISN